MRMTTQLSVSSAILAAVLSGCSQQQVIGGSQLSGSQQMAGSAQVGSQQQVETATPVVQPRTVKPVIKAKPVRVYTRGPKPQKAHSVKRSGMGLPPAKPGQCFAKVKVPANYQTKSKRVLIEKASSKRVLVRAPQYRWVNKKVLVRKATYRNRVIPAQYRNQVKRVMVKPAYNTWRKGHGAITRIDNMTGEIMCRVTVPAVYKNVSQRVLVRPARTIRTFVPAVYKWVKQKQRVSAAQYKTVHRPARYVTKNYRVKVAAARYVWRPVLCKTNAPKNYRKTALKHRPVVRSQATRYKRPAKGISHQEYLQVMKSRAPMKKKPAAVKKPVVAPDKKAVMEKAPAKAAATAEKPSKTAIKKNIVYGIQAALKSKGFDPGSLDGKMGPNTAAALKAFQSSRGLPVGVLSKDTFRALGLVR